VGGSDGTAWAVTGCQQLSLSRAVVLVLPLSWRTAHGADRGQPRQAGARATPSEPRPSPARVRAAPVRARGGGGGNAERHDTKSTSTLLDYSLLIITPRFCFACSAVRSATATHDVTCFSPTAISPLPPPPCRRTAHSRRHAQHLAVAAQPRHRPTPPPPHSIRHLALRTVRHRGATHCALCAVCCLCVVAWRWAVPRVVPSYCNAHHTLPYYCTPRTKHQKR
jgi:hypothetical protein